MKTYKAISEPSLAAIADELTRVHKERWDFVPASISYSNGYYHCLVVKEN